MEVNQRIISFLRNMGVITHYKLKKDNPCHCLQIHFWALQEGTVCIYPDEITVIPAGKDGFSVKYKKIIPYALESKEQPDNYQI